MHFVFTTLQTYESEFYGRAGEELERRGHRVSHLSYSRRAARVLRAGGKDATCLPDLIAALPPADERKETARIEHDYELPSIRELYRTDPPCADRPEAWCISRTVGHVRAIERYFDDVRPDVLVPEVGSELIRRVSHTVALARGIPTLLLFYTIFPRPLRLAIDVLHGPIVPAHEVRPLTRAEHDEVEEFRREFIARAQPIREYRTASFHPRRVTTFVSHLRAKAGEDRDNVYLRPRHWLWQTGAERARAFGARALYGEIPSERPFVYFPIHVTDDYKIKGLIPHCQDQASIVEQVADALPPGYDLVLKEHPMAIGRNPLSLLRRLRRRANIVVVSPYTSSHDLIRRSSGVAVISSTVGLEALLHEQPVLTIGRPFYAGYGITIDVDSFAELREQVPALLRFRPDPERIRRFLHAAMRSGRAGAPVLVDRSPENAVTLAASLDDAARALEPAATAQR